MAQFTAYGKGIKKRLIDIDRTQEWLIEEVGKLTGLYFDSSYLYKIMVGTQASPKIINAINAILDSEE